MARATRGQRRLPLFGSGHVEREFEKVIVRAQAQNLAGDRVPGRRLVVVLNLLDDG